MEHSERDRKADAQSLLTRVKQLAEDGLNQKQIAQSLGFKTTFTLNNRLVKASQETGQAVPRFKPERGGKKGLKRVEEVQVKRRGKGNAFGVNIPQEPLERAGLKPGDKLRLTVRGKTISLKK